MISCLLLISSCNGPVVENNKIDSASRTDSAYIKVIFENGLIQDDKFSFSTFQQNIFDYDAVAKVHDKLLDSAEWNKLYKTILNKYRTQGDTVNHDDNKMYPYGDYKIYLITSKDDILLINNDNDIFYKGKNGIVTFQDKDFGDKIRSLIDYYNYFEKVDLIYLSGNSAFLDKHKYKAIKNSSDPPKTYCEVDVKYK
ncbi:hypothetical protein [Sphingobacterium sp. 40-24]|uniref:hypothetical protein n=1 Tax=Sphingobacterium sp. 40-24 TaxID=1895843 RepID=UPI00096899DF|nr:hypothetical protein [Sphingobacterium sp. 40-24]OJZ06256.1 MAG: hypothetical protein BGP15_11045 [Sphingobacterium sp. 40-24]